MIPSLRNQLMLIAATGNKIFSFAGFCYITDNAKPVVFCYYTPAKLLLSHTVFNIAVVFFKVHIHTVFGRVPVKRGVFFFQDISQQGIILL